MTSGGYPFLSKVALMNINSLCMNSKFGQILQVLPNRHLISPILYTRDVRLDQFKWSVMTWYLCLQTYP